MIRRFFALVQAFITGRSPRWPAAREAHLHRQPTCQACGTRYNLEVHHVWPFGWPGGERLELDDGNMITLCETPGRDCHLNIGHLGDWRSRNPDVVADAAARLAKVRARPYPTDANGGRKSASGADGANGPNAPMTSGDADSAAPRTYMDSMDRSNR